MSKTSKNKWKRFEDLAAHIQRTLAPGAIVEQNVRIVGKRSGVKREIDIVVRMKAGQYDLFVAIDCKDYNRKVDVKAVEEFIGLAKDVGANKGAMIGSRGFTDAAKTRARDAGIDLYTLVDAEAHEWQAYVTIPALVEDVSINTFSLSFSGTEPIRIAPQDFREMTLYRADGSTIGVVRNLLARQWNHEAVPHEPGEHRDIALTYEETHVLTEGVLYRVNVRANLKVAKTLYFGRLPLVEVQGFADELGGGLITRSSITTADLNFAKVHEQWQVIQSRDELAVQPVITMGVSSHYPTSADPE